VSSLVGIAQHPDKIFADRSAGRRDDQQAFLVLQAVVCYRRYMQSRPIHSYLDVAGHEANAVPQRPWYDQPPSLIYGRPHTISVP
jgi:hypothetical protein